MKACGQSPSLFFLPWFWSMPPVPNAHFLHPKHCFQKAWYDNYHKAKKWLLHNLVHSLTWNGINHAEQSCNKIESGEHYTWWPHPIKGFLGSANKIWFCIQEYNETYECRLPWWWLWRWLFFAFDHLFS